MNPRNTEPARLPRYQALLAVDVADFSGYQGRDHQIITDDIPDILRSAFVTVGQGDVWADRTFGRSLGDGYAAGFPPHHLPFLLNPLLPALQRELDRRNREQPVDPTRPLRMRVSVGVGPVEESRLGSEGDNGGGVARIELHRLLDAPELKQLLTRSTTATSVVAVVSERAVQDAVEPGYSAEDPSSYVRMATAVKSYRGTAYLRVPVPSGALLTHGFLAEPPGSSDRTEHGGRPPRNRHQVVRGSVYGPVHTGDGDQHNDLRNAYRRTGHDES